MNARLGAVSPSGQFIVFGLPFQGRKPHPLDGKLRIFLGNPQLSSTDKHQTSLPVTFRTHLDWVPAATPPTFRIWDEHGTRMLWQVEDRKAVCVQGREFLAPDPYADEVSTQ